MLCTYTLSSFSWYCWSLSILFRSRCLVLFCISKSDVDDDNALWKSVERCLTTTKKSSYESFRIWQYITIFAKITKVKIKLNNIKYIKIIQTLVVTTKNNSKKNMKLKTIQELWFLILLNGVSFILFFKQSRNHEINCIVQEIPHFWLIIYEKEHMCF